MAAATRAGSVDEWDKPSCAPAIGGIGRAESHQVLLLFDPSRCQQTGRCRDGQEQAGERHVLEEYAPGEHEERGVHGMPEVAVDTDVDELAGVLPREVRRLGTLFAGLAVGAEKVTGLIPPAGASRR